MKPITNETVMSLGTDASMVRQITRLCLLPW